MVASPPDHVALRRPRHSSPDSGLVLLIAFPIGTLRSKRTKRRVEVETPQTFHPLHVHNRRLTRVSRCVAAVTVPLLQVAETYLPDPGDTASVSPLVRPVRAAQYIAARQVVPFLGQVTFRRVVFQRHLYLDMG